MEEVTTATLYQLYELAERVRQEWLNRGLEKVTSRKQPASYGRS